jgi:hypothetical protein
MIRNLRLQHVLLRQVSYWIEAMDGQPNGQT